MTDIAGIDVGLSFIEPSSGISHSVNGGFCVAHTFADTLSRREHLCPQTIVDVLAIDGPVLPIGVLNYEVRPCEKVFVWRLFHGRCRPGESHIRGTGQALRRAGCETAVQFGCQVSAVGLQVTFPRIQVGRNIVEAFPNGFLGVCLSQNVYDGMPDLARSEKFDWLMDQCVAGGIFGALQHLIGWAHPQFLAALNTNGQHDERAALVCVLTAACVAMGRYVAVGEEIGGYFFMPPWDAWNQWAKTTLDLNRRDHRLPRPVRVWIDGQCFSVNDALPD